MFAASDIAEWWDEQHQISKAGLDQFVDANPNMFGVVVGGLLATAMDVGAGTVDVLKLGQGTAEGGWGIAKDALRIVGIAGPIGKAGKMVHSAKGIKLARAVSDPGGNICGWVTVTQALRQLGKRAFASVDDVAKALGKTSKVVEGRPMAAHLDDLAALGVKVGAPRLAKSLKDIERILPRDGSIVIFSIKRLPPRAGMSNTHTMYAFRDLRERMKFMDRSGVFDSIEDFAKHYRLRGLEFQVMSKLDNAFMKFVGPSGTATLATQILATTSTEPSTVAQTFEIFKSLLANKTPDGAKHSVKAGETISMLAKRYYDDEFKWPVIHQANRGILGASPRILLGQDLLVPELPVVRGVKPRNYQPHQSPLLVA